ncbi:MAG: tetratricopeptide repeat protein [Olegusella sp.]|jgi:tetratricopeptide (TPR) repeat protein|nr:tetratricopeptide repeat protein [Olegusella sp.]
MDVSNFYTQLDHLYDTEGADVAGYLQNHLRLARSQRDEIGIATIANELGSVLRIRGELNESEALYHETLSILKNHNATDKQISIILINLGDVYVAMGRFQLAVNTFNQAETLLADDDKYERSAVYNNRSSAYRGLGDFFEARKNLQKAEELLENIPNAREELAVNTINLAQILMDQGRLQEANNIVTKALLIYKTLNNGNDIHRPNALATAGKINYLMGNYKVAACFYERAANSLFKKLGESKTVESLRQEAKRIKQLADKVEKEKFHIQN